MCNQAWTDLGKKQKQKKKQKQQQSKKKHTMAGKG